MAAVVIDANLAVCLVTPDEQRPNVRAQFAVWASERTDLVVPPHFFAEVLSSLRRKVFAHQLSEAEEDTAVGFFFSLLVRRESPPELQPLAWEVAKQHNLPTTYDAEYMALARLLDCDFYTADGRFVRSLGNAKPDWVRFIA